MSMSENKCLPEIPLETRADGSIKNRWNGSSSI